MAVQFRANVGTKSKMFQGIQGRSIRKLAVGIIAPNCENGPRRRPDTDLDLAIAIVYRIRNGDKLHADTTSDGDNSIFACGAKVLPESLREKSLVVSQRLFASFCLVPWSRRFCGACSSSAELNLVLREGMACDVSKPCRRVRDDDVVGDFIEVVVVANEQEVIDPIDVARACWKMLY